MNDLTKEEKVLILRVFLIAILNNTVEDEDMDMAKSLMYKINNSDN